MNEGLGPAESHTDGNHRVAQKRKRRPGRIQALEPAAQRGGIGHAIGIFDGGRRVFPRTAFHEIAPQRLAAGDKAVVAVGRREGRQEGERLPAAAAKAAPNRNPIVMFVVSLFAAAAMADDRVLEANRASAKNDIRAGLGPIGAGIELIGGKWDNENRSNGGSASGQDLANDRDPTRSPRLPSKNLNWKRRMLPAGRYRCVRSRDWPVNTNA